MCTKWHVWFNVHVLSMRLPPPSPTKQCWYTYVSYSFAAHYLWQHWFWGVGNRVFITKCPNSFVQDWGLGTNKTMSQQIHIICINVESLYDNESYLNSNLHIITCIHGWLPSRLNKNYNRKKCTCRCVSNK